MAPRRSHRKSKKGCSECKRRHIKCDETRPVCVNCRTSKRRCTWEIDPSDYATQRGPSINTTPIDLDSPAEPALVASLESYSTPKIHSPLQTIAHSSSSTTVNLDHLELLYHFYTDTCTTFVRTADQVDLYRNTVVQQAFLHPFLMQQLLACSAIHLAVLRPHRRDYYHSLATSLQSDALAGFNELLLQVDAGNCLTVLLFSHLIGLHVFHDIFNSSKGDFNSFMDGLTSCVKLLRGVNVVIRTWWDVLTQSELRSIIMEAEEVRLMTKDSLGECLPLRELVNTADLSPSSKTACEEALNALQEYFDVENAYPGEPLATSNVIFAWFVTASTQYTELVDQRRPEALVLMAFYAVLLHRRPHLGRRWDSWLLWPRSVVNSRTSSNTPIS